MSNERTTLTLDPDVARLIEDAVHRERRPRKHVINDAIRRGLGNPTARRSKPYRVVPFEASLQPGIDHTGLNRLADELEDEEIIAKVRHDS